jgi:uncharacterized membrane protein YeaQ/YmgE (transglycosylase-associated protein family)
MIGVEWIAFLIALIASLLKALWEGREAKTSILFIILITIIGAVVGILFGFINAFLSQTTFTMTQADLIADLFNSFIGAVIIPIARYLTTIKLE